MREVYRRLLNRNAEAGGLDYWSGEIRRLQDLGRSASEARSEVGFAIDESVERRRNLINEWHLLYLSRTATPNELDAYLALLEQGLSQRTVQRLLIDSVEYANKPPLPPTGTAIRVV